MLENYKKYEPIFGSWYIKGLIGEGSYGKVYEIERRDFGVYKSALKIISIPKSDAEIEAARSEGMDDTSLKSYYRSLVDEIVKEFALMSKLKGTANVVSYEDHLVVPHDNGIGWDVLIRMELLTSLKTHLTTNTMTERDVIKMGSDICHALELCEKQKIIHRDIKPENIFISPNGDYKLGDFGIARTVEATMDGLSKKGTFFYMAPEVYRGGTYGGSVDIYSLGMVMYFFLNNKRHPFMPPSPQPIKFNDRETALRNLMTGKALPRPVHGSEELWKIVKKATEYRAEDRFSSPMEMRRMLDNLLVNDTLACNRLILGADNAVGFGQYFSDADSARLPDGPGTAMLDLVGNLGNTDETFDVSMIRREPLKNTASASTAYQTYEKYNTPIGNPTIPPAPPGQKKDGIGTKLLIGIIFAFILIIVFVFAVISAALGGTGSDTPMEDDNDNVIVDNENTDEDEDKDENDDNKDDTVKKEDNTAPQKLILSESTLNLNVNQIYTIHVSVSPADAEVGALSWSSSNESVAKVNKSGTITAVGSGMAGITVTMDGLTATCTVIVQEAVTVTGIDIASPPAKTEYNVGESLSTDGLAILVNYSDGSSQIVTSGFSVNSEPFAAAGKFKITISYAEHQASFEVVVTTNEPVVEPETPVE